MRETKQKLFSQLDKLDAKTNLSLEEWISVDDEKWEILLQLTEEEQHEYSQNQVLNENHMDEMHELDTV